MVSKKTDVHTLALISVLLIQIICMQVCSALDGDDAIKSAQEVKAGRFSSLLRAGNNVEVIKQTTQTLSKDPKNVEAYYCRAIALEGNRLTQDRALQDLDKALALNPSMVQALTLKAVILHEQQEDEVALPVIEKACTLAPSDLDIASAKAKILNALRRPKDALAIEDVAVKKAPKIDRFHYVRSQSLKQLNRFDEALKELDETIALSPGVVVYRNDRMALCTRQKQWPRVLEDADFVLAHSNRKRDALERRGAAHVGLKQYKEAIADFKQAITETHNDSQIRILHVQLKSVYNLSGDEKNASLESEYIKKLDDDVRPL